MHTVAGVAGVERAVGVGQAGVKIDPLATVVKRILPQHPVEPVDPVGSVGHFGAPATTSHWNRANICAVTCPLIPRAAKPFASKNEG